MTRFQLLSCEKLILIQARALRFEAIDRSIERNKWRWWSIYLSVAVESASRLRDSVEWDNLIKPDAFPLSAFFELVRYCNAQGRKGHLGRWLACLPPYRQFEAYRQIMARYKI